MLTGRYFFFFFFLFVCFVLLFFFVLPFFIVEMYFKRHFEIYLYLFFSGCTQFDVYKLCYNQILNKTYIYDKMKRYTLLLNELL